MVEQEQFGNIEEQRDFDPAREKRTLDNNRAKGGLNDGNPNTDSTPASSVQQASRDIEQEAHSGNTTDTDQGNR